MATVKELEGRIDAIAVRLDKIEQALHFTERPSSTPMREREYIVAEGDTLATIARSQLGNPGRLRDIAILNKLESPESIFVGQVLRIPAN